MGRDDQGHAGPPRSGTSVAEVGGGPDGSSGLADELADMQAEVERLRAENARLLRLLELSPREARPPGPAQLGFFEARPGPVHAGSLAAQKVAFFAAGPRPAASSTSRCCRP